MDSLISALNTATGWTATGGIAVETTNIPDLQASGHASSVALRVPAGSQGAYASVPVTFDATGYEWVSLSIASFREPRPSIVRRGDASYSITVGGSEFYVPVTGQLTRVCLPVDGFSQVGALRITVRHGGSDYLVVSDLRAHSSGMPTDLLLAVKASISAQSLRLNGTGRKIGKVTAAAGATEVTVDSNWDWVEPNVVLTFNSETHQVMNVNGSSVTFMPSYGGAAVLADCTESDVYVTLPVEVGYFDREAALPGVTVWYTSPAPAERHSCASKSVACIGPLGSYVRREGKLSLWTVSLEVASRSPELGAAAADAVRAFLATSRVWVQGEPLWFDWNEPAVDAEPVDGYDIVPRASYALKVEIREDSWQLERLTSGSASLTVTPSL